MSFCFAPACDPESGQKSLAPLLLPVVHFAQQRVQSQSRQQRGYHLHHGEAHALLTAFDENGELITQERVAPDFKLTAAVAQTWIESDFRQAGRDES